jgi:hypothetical protein
MKGHANDSAGLSKRATSDNMGCQQKRTSNYCQISNHKKINAQVLHTAR